MFLKKCSCRDQWRDERLALLTQISDLTQANQKINEQALSLQSELLERFLRFLKPSTPLPPGVLKNGQGQAASQQQNPLWPYLRPTHRPPSDAADAGPSSLPGENLERQSAASPSATDGLFREFRDSTLHRS